MEEPKRYGDMLLSPYVDGVEDQPLRPGHEQYLTYMPKGMSLTKDMVDTRRVSLGQRGGVAIKQSFNSDSCDVAMNIETIQPSDGTNLEEDIRYLIGAAPQGNRQFSINVEHDEKLSIDTTLDAELQELPAELQLRELDNALDKIHDLDQRHVVRLAQGKNLVLSDFRQLMLLSAAVKTHSYDENLREVQILSTVSLEGHQTTSSYDKVSVIRRGHDDTYLTVQLVGDNKLGVYAEGLPNRSADDHAHYAMKEKLDSMYERLQEQLRGQLQDPLGAGSPHLAMSLQSTKNRRNRLEALEIVRKDANKLTFQDNINLNDPSFDKVPLEEIIDSAIQRALYQVSTEYRVDMELEHQEEQSIDISDLSDNDVQNLEV